MNKIKVGSYYVYKDSRFSQTVSIVKVTVVNNNGIDFDIISNPWPNVGNHPDTGEPQIYYFNSYSCTLNSPMAEGMIEISESQVELYKTIYE